MIPAREQSLDERSTETKQGDSFGTFLDAVRERDVRAPQHVREASTLSVSDSARSGLIALSGLLQQREVSDAVMLFRTHYKSVSENIDLLADYKSIHDLLHTLELSYPLLRLQVGNNSINEHLLLHFELRLSGIVEELRSLVRKAPKLSPEESWIQTLEQAQTELGVAANNDPERWPENPGLRLIRTVLDIQPVRINARLMSIANGVELSTLIQALVVLLDRIAKIDLDPAKIVGFADGVEFLERANEDFHKLINEHDRWQEMDTELRMIEGYLEYDTKALNVLWVRVRDKVIELIAGTDDPWANQIRTDINRLESAIDANDRDRITETFLHFRTLASHRFYFVDRALLELCQSLRKAIQPLDSLLSIV